ncbi:nitroreductase family deazaflavin-dependent oxidoreductase [Promicromonospora iranensis]|uniref:Deazaflavin-dependent oxidoreductase (Nitroreductase family) n=1 Tax=Promicromonospora iranensis TaxID=1105144 RepID=A0ABU2CJR9_9MICO|nr:nitroreductase family deazaflavin-dependent oxidoreductase [Promicromonospora iranensis]MDR7381582.1 deazaflavin-dependent oxidoreductase (nitroreductase family) [Promicromonospora iranensis]
MAAPDLVVKAGKIVNPWMLRVAGRVPPWVVLHHVGRRSGTGYRTPLVAFAARPEQEIVAVLPLPWGSGTDWARNTMSAGTVRLTRGGKEFVVKDVRLVPAYEAVGWLASVPSMLLSAVGIEDCLVGTLHPA